MAFPSSKDESSLRERARGNDLEAYDLLGTLLYDKEQYTEAADFYLKAYVAGYYKTNERPRSSENLHEMWQRGLLSGNSDAARLFQHLRTQSTETSERARSTGTKAALITFVVYQVIIYGGGVNGILRDFSLIIAGALAWLAWKLVISGFEQ